MAVRRSVRRSTEDGTRHPPLPERLHAPPFVEDWVEQDEAPPEWWFAGTAVSDDRAVETMGWLAITAACRLNEAQVAWAKEVEMPWTEFASLHDRWCRPEWHNWRAFVAHRADLRELLERWAG
jgi:hypothetical protein